MRSACVDRGTSRNCCRDSLLPFIEKEYHRFIIVEGDDDDEEDEEEEGKGKEKEKEKRTEEECDKAVFEFFSNLFSNLQ